MTVAPAQAGPTPAPPAGRFIDQGAIVAGWVGIGMAVTIGISFLMVIPIEPVYWLLTPFAGLLIGYYANQRSVTPRGAWRRILVDALYAGLVTGLTLALLLLVVKAIFFYVDTGYPDFNRTQDGQPIPPLCETGADCVRARYIAAGRGPALEAAGVTDDTSFTALVLAAAAEHCRPAPRRRARRLGRRRRRLRDHPTGSRRDLLGGVDALNPDAPAGCRGVESGSGRVESSSGYFAAGFFAGVFALALAAGALAFAVVVFGVVAFGFAGALAGLAAGFAGVVASTVSAAALALAAASARAVLLSAARALPAAVCAPLALPALPSAIRVLAAFAAAALPVVLVTFPPVWTLAPPRAALTLRVSRDLRRAAAFGWIAPALAARSRALSAAARASVGSPSTVPAATRTAFAVRVFAALRRGWLISVRRSAVRTRFRADGVLAPVQPRGFVAKSEPHRDGRSGRAGGWSPSGTPMVARGDRPGQHA